MLWLSDTKTFRDLREMGPRFVKNTLLDSNSKQFISLLFSILRQFAVWRGIKDEVRSHQFYYTFPFRSDFKEMLLIYIIWKEGDKSNLFVRCFQNANFSNTRACACHLTDCGK